MSSIYGYYNGENIVPSSPVDFKKNQKVLIMPINDLGDNYEIILDSIDYEYNKTRYIFNEPYRLVIHKEKGNDVPFWYCIEDEELGILDMEESEEEIIKSFYSWIDMLYNEFAMEDDAKLSKNSIVLKNKLLQLIKEVVRYDVKNTGY